MHNHPSFLEPTPEEQWNDSTDENFNSLDTNHLWYYQDSKTLPEEALFPDEYFTSEEAGLAVTEEYVLYEEKYWLRWEEDAPHRNVKQGRRTRDFGNDEVLSFRGEEN